MTRSALARTIAVMRQRAAALAVSGGSFRASGSDEITVQLPNLKGLAHAEKVIGTTARLQFYDWEANALTPNGKTVASQLRAQDPTALTTSQGSGGAASGDPGAGSMSLYEAVRLASRQRPQVSSDGSRPGPLYYLFGSPGSVACATIARDQGETTAPKVHCLLAGPESNRADSTPSSSPSLRSTSGHIPTASMPAAATSPAA